MSIVLSFSRRRNSYSLLRHSRFLRRFSDGVDLQPIIKPESQESVVAGFLENLHKIPQEDWATNESLNSLLESSSSVSPLVYSKITKRLGSYSLAVSFLEYLDAKSESLNSREESLSSAFQSLIEFTGSERDSSDKLLQLYSIAKEKKFPFNDITIKLMIRWFGRIGMVNQSVVIYEGLDSNMKNTQVRNAMIDVLLKNGLVNDAFKVLDEMLQTESVSPPNRLTTEIVLHEVWRGRLLTEEKIIELISRFSSHGVSPNPIWLTRFLTSLCKVARTDVALQILNDLMKNKAPLEAPPFNSVLNSLGRNMDIKRMNELVLKMDELEIRPDVVTLGILINTLCKSRRVDEALEVFEQMSDEKAIKPDLIHFNTLINGFCKVGRMKEAEDLFVKMKQDPNCKPNTITYNSLIDGYCRTGLLETAKEVVSRMIEDGFKPNVVTVNTMIGGMCKHNGVNTAVRFLTDMEKEGLRGNVVTYMTLINAYCSVGNIENAMHWFDQMTENGLFPDAKIYYVLISGLCQVKRDQDVVRLIEKLKKSGFSLDLLAYNMVIGLFCEKNNGEKVYELLNEMEELGLKPDSVTYNTLVSFFGKHKDFESVEKMLEEMRKDGLVPNVVTYGAIIEAYCSKGEINEAMRVFKEMGLRSNVKPNTVIYNILITAFTRFGNLGEALRLKEEMKEKMVRGNVETYNALFKCLSKDKNQVEMVLKLMDEMVKCSVEPNRITLEILMGCVETSKVHRFSQGYSVSSSSSSSMIENVSSSPLAW